MFANGSCPLGHERRKKTKQKNKQIKKKNKKKKKKKKKKTRVLIHDIFQANFQLSGYNQTFFIPTKLVLIISWLARNLRSSGDSLSEIMQCYSVEYLHKHIWFGYFIFNSSQNIFFRILLELPLLGDSSKLQKRIFYMKLRIKPDLYYIRYIH